MKVWELLCDNKKKILIQIFATRCVFYIELVSTHLGQFTNLITTKHVLHDGYHHCQLPSASVKWHVPQLTTVCSEKKVVNVFWNPIFKIRCSSWIIRTYQTFRIISKLKVAWIKVRRSRRPNIKKVVTNEAFFYEVSFLNIHNTMANVWRCSALHKTFCKRHWRACKSSTTSFFNNNMYCWWSNTLQDLYRIIPRKI